MVKQDLNLLKGSCNNAINCILQNLSFGLYNRPEKIASVFTLRCNLRCKHCYLRNYAGHELSTNEWEEGISNLRQWLGYFPLYITGGEPLMREDLCGLINFAHRLGIVTVLSTNGTLIDGHTADRLIESGLDIIVLSLDGSKEETHDFLRGEGVYRKVMNAIVRLKGRIRLNISTTIMSHNLDELADLAEFVISRRLGISFQGLYWRFNNQVSYSNYGDNELWPKDIEKIERAIDELIALKRRVGNIRNSIRHLELIKLYYSCSYNNTYYSCPAYKNNFNISHDGSVRLCNRFEPIGNIGLELPEAIWNSKKADFQRGQIKRCNATCSFTNCYFGENIMEKIVRLKNTFFAAY